MVSAMRVSSLEDHAALDDEREIVLAVIKGDEEAFARLIVFYSPMIYGFLKRMLFSVEDAEDLTQETFCEVFKNRETLKSARERFNR